MSVKNFFIIQDDEVTILLTKGKTALLDFQDWVNVFQFSWCADWSYAAAKIKGKKINLHKYLTGYKEVDHANQNPSDNRRTNLRDSTHAQNNMNKPKQKGNYSSQYKGVSWDKKKKHWRADIKKNRRNRTLGYFSSEIAAAQAYNEAATKYFGEFAYLNQIPKTSQEYCQPS